LRRANRRARFTQPRRPHLARLRDFIRSSSDRHGLLHGTGGGSRPPSALGERSGTTTKGEGSHAHSPPHPRISPSPSMAGNGPPDRCRHGGPVPHRRGRRGGGHGGPTEQGQGG